MTRAGALLRLLNSQVAKLKGRAETIRRLQSKLDALTPHPTQFMCSHCCGTIWSNHSMIIDKNKNFHAECWISKKLKEERESSKKYRESAVDLYNSSSFYVPSTKRNSWLKKYPWLEEPND